MGPWATAAPRAKCLSRSCISPGGRVRPRSGRRQGAGGRTKAALEWVKNLHTRNHALKPWLKHQRAKGRSLVWGRRHIVFPHVAPVTAQESAGLQSHAEPVNDGRIVACDLDVSASWCASRASLAGMSADETGPEGMTREEGFAQRWDNPISMEVEPTVPQIFERHGVTNSDDQPADVERLRAEGAFSPMELDVLRDAGALGREVA